MPPAFKSFGYGETFLYTHRYTPVFKCKSCKGYILLDGVKKGGVQQHPFHILSHTALRGRRLPLCPQGRRKRRKIKHLRHEPRHQDKADTCPAVSPHRKAPAQRCQNLRVQGKYPSTRKQPCPSMQTEKAAAFRPTSSQLHSQEGKDDDMTRATSAAQSRCAWRSSADAVKRRHNENRTRIRCSQISTRPGPNLRRRQYPI